MWGTDTRRPEAGAVEDDDRALLGRRADSADTETSEEEQTEPTVPAGRIRRRRWVSPLVRRILPVNLIAPILLVAGLLYLDRYETELIQGELAVMQTQARLYALALGQAAVDRVDVDEVDLSREAVLRIVNRITPSGAPRVRVFDEAGELMVDSRRILGTGGVIEIEQLPPPDDRSTLSKVMVWIYEAVVGLMPDFDGRERYPERPEAGAKVYGEVSSALAGEASAAVYATSDGDLVLTVAEPIQHYKRVIGALMLSTDGRHIADSIRSVRLEILTVFGAALVITVLLSIYLASVLARPVRQLAQAAQRVRSRRPEEVEIPDLGARGDEIGELSVALREMTEALNSRIHAIELFAADVAHEIKNPLSSLRSAVETVARVEDPEQQRRLIAIVIEDVQRLDRLISDISDASRLDAELSRARIERIDLVPMLRMLVEIEQATSEGDADAPDIVLEHDHGRGGESIVQGVESRLVQVFRNLLANARSFSPPRGRIRVRVMRRGEWVLVTIDDEGPGIPPGKEKAIFERFYSERPEGEKFGTHSGLGLSISRQIAEAHGGRLVAESRRGPEGQILGARFSVWLPASDVGDEHDDHRER